MRVPEVSLVREYMHGALSSVCPTEDLLAPACEPRSDAVRQFGSREADKQGSLEARSGAEREYGVCAHRGSLLQDRDST